MHLFGLNWDLQPSRQMYQLSEDNSSRLSFPTDLSLPPLGNTGLDVVGRRGNEDGAYTQKRCTAAFATSTRNRCFHLDCVFHACVNCSVTTGGWGIIGGG